MITAQNQNKSSSPPASNKGQDSYKSLIGFVNNLIKFCKILKFGVTKVNFKKIDPWIYMGFISILGVYLSYKNMLHVKAFHYLLGSTDFGHFCTKLLLHIPNWFHCLCLILGPIVTGFLLVALRHKNRLKPYQEKLDFLGLKSANGSRPQVLDVKNIDNNKTELLISTQGIGKKRYMEKFDDAKTSFGEIVHSVKEHSNLNNVILTLAKQELPSKVLYSEMKTYLKKPYTFLVGQSLNGPVVESLVNLPHMLIAGTTGGGKSVYFNNVLLGLMQSTEKIEFRLIDLKAGVEVQQYKEFPNVEIATNTSEAIDMLDELNEEMNRRLEKMKELEIKKINPGDPKFPIIVCAIDEASVLFTLDRTDKNNKEASLKARHLAQNIAKLARACGIHMILATQKVTKETIDTKVQDNVQGRMCFKMSTIPSSNTVLGNKKAYELPDTKGRGIWFKGNQFLEVQAPFLSEEEVQDIAAAMLEKFNAIYGAREEKVDQSEKEENKVEKKLEAFSDEE